MKKWLILIFITILSINQLQGACRAGLSSLDRSTWFADAFKQRALMFKKMGLNEIPTAEELAEKSGKLLSKFLEKKSRGEIDQVLVEQIAYFNLTYILKYTNLFLGYFIYKHPDFDFETKVLQSVFKVIELYDPTRGTKITSPIIAALKNTLFNLKRDYLRQLRRGVWSDVPKDITPERVPNESLEGETIDRKDENALTPFEILSSKDQFMLTRCKKYSGLTEQEQKIFEQLFIEGLTTEEAADRNNKNYKAISVTRSVIVRKVKEYLKRCKIKSRIQYNSAN